MNLCPAKPSPLAGQQPAPPTLPRIACCTKSSVCLPCAVVQTVNLADSKLLYCGFPGEEIQSLSAYSERPQGGWLGCNDVSSGDILAVAICLPGHLSASYPLFKQGLDHLPDSLIH